MPLPIEISFEEEDELHLHFTGADPQPDEIEPQELQTCALCTRLIGEEVN